MEKKKLEIEEMRLLLINNMFEEIDDEDEDKMGYFFTPFQIRLRLKVPVDNEEFNMALQMLGFRSYYEGHTVPSNPDEASFTIKTNPDEEKYIQTLIPKTKLDVIETFIEEDDNFNKFMRDKCEADAKALLGETDFVCFSMVTSTPSEHFGHLLTYAATEIKDNLKTDRQAHIFIDHSLNEKEIKDYITPYKEGVKSSYERTGIALPGMPECTNPELFTNSMDALRTYYQICNNKNVVVDDPVQIKNFVGRLVKNKGLPDSNSIENLAKNYISLRRVSKYLFDEYLSLFDLGLKLKYSKMKKLGAIGEADTLCDVVNILRENKEELLKNKEERES